jgi:hypothetical protein
MWRHSRLLPSPVQRKGLPKRTEKEGLPPRNAASACDIGCQVVMSLAGFAERPHLLH